MMIERDDITRVLWTFAQAAAGAAFVVLTAQSSIPDSWSGWRQLGAVLLTAMAAAVVSAAKNLVIAKRREAPPG